MKAYYIFKQADEETISNILDWMRNQERAIYCAAVRELGALKKLRPEFIQRKPLQEQFSFIKKMLSWKPSNEIGDHLLQVWLLRKHQDMLITFLNTLGIPHDGNGIVNELPETLDKEKLAKAVDELFEKYPAGVASVYLQMFQLQTEDGWEELAEVLANDPRVTIRLRYSPPGHKQGPLRSEDGPFYGGKRTLLPLLFQFQAEQASGRHGTCLKQLQWKACRKRKPVRRERCPAVPDGMTTPHLRGTPSYGTCRRQ